MIDKENEIILINRAKVAYLVSKGFNYLRLEKIKLDNQDEQFGFVFKKSEELKELIESFNSNEELRLFNQQFKFLSYEIHRAKELM